MIVLRTIVMVVPGICLNWLVCANTQAQVFPAKPVRYIVPSTGGSEIIARLAAQGLTQTLGQQVYVDVRTGAGGNVGAEIAAKAAADGYTLLQVTQAHSVNMSLYRTLAYDMLRDFAPVSKMDIAPMIVVVHPSLPVKSMRELTQLAKARPGEIHYASAGVGTSTYLAGELFRSVSGVNLLEVPYRGGAAAQNAVVAGEVSVYFAPLATGLPFVHDKRLRLLGVASSARLPALPDVPTVAEQGFPGYEASNWHGLVAPAKTPREIINTLNKATLSALQLPDVARRMRDLGYTIVGDAPDVFGAFIKADIEKWRKIVKQRGISAE